MRKADILDRIIKHYDLKNKTGLASFLGVSPQTVSNWYSRDSIDYDLIFEKCSGVDYNWLVAGDSYGYKDNTRNVTVAADYRTSYEVPVVRNRTIPVIAGDETLGSGDDGMVVITFCDTVTIPENMLAEGEYVAYRTDDSMSPAFPSGDHLVCKRVVDFDGRKLREASTYLFAISGEKLLLRRAFIEKNQPNRIILKADNTNMILYPDIKVNLRDIRDVWEVKLSLSQPEICTNEMEKRLEKLESGFSDIHKMIEYILTKVDPR